MWVKEIILVIRVMLAHVVLKAKAIGASSRAVVPNWLRQLMQLVASDETSEPNTPREDCGHGHGHMAIEANGHRPKFGVFVFASRRRVYFVVRLSEPEPNGSGGAW